MKGRDRKVVVRRTKNGKTTTRIIWYLDLQAHRARLEPYGYSDFAWHDLGATEWKPLPT